jgi:hypothetical protein
VLATLAAPVEAGQQLLAVAENAIEVGLAVLGGMRDR